MLYRVSCNYVVVVVLTISYYYCMAIVSAETCEAKHMRYADSDYDEDDEVKCY